MSRTLLVAVLAAVLLLPQPQNSSAQAAPFCEVSQSPQFVFGFASLKDQIGDAMGGPIECEHANPENGDTLQQTSTGLSFYRKSTNTPTFTDGFNHWGLTADGLVTWTGASIDPPGVIIPTPTATPTPPPATATPTATPSPTATATPASPTFTPTPTFGSRENPIPIGALGRFSDGWNVVVVSTTPNANQIVLKENPFNDPPAPGQQFFIARVQATYTGPGNRRFNDSRLQAVGAASVSYRTFTNHCGVIPDELTENEVFTGGTIVGNVCWAIRSSAASSLVMYDGDDRNESRIFLSLH